MGPGRPQFGCGWVWLMISALVVSCVQWCGHCENFTL